MYYNRKRIVTLWLYAFLTFLFQQLYSISLPRLSQRSRHPDLDLQYNFLYQWTITSNDTSPYSVVIYLHSHYSWICIFLICPPIVLSPRKIPIGLVYKLPLVPPISLASSVHYLPSNLVLPLSLSLDLSLISFLSLHLKERRTSLRLVAWLRLYQPLVFMLSLSELTGFVHVLALHLSGCC